MSAVLNPTHRWGQRPIFGPEKPRSSRLVVRMIPCCLNCLVDGYEDEPDAFQPCRRVNNPCRWCLVKIYIEPRDWWIGYYRGDTHHYVCPLPCVVIRWKRGAS